MGVLTSGLCLPADALTDAATSAAFLKLPVGARNAAMGATGAAEASAYSSYWNPAGLEALPGREVAYSYASWLTGISHHFLGYGQKTALGSFGASLQYVSVPGIQKYDNTGAPLSDQYSPLDSLASVSYANRISRLAVGATLKGIYSRLDDRSARTVAADLGLRVDSLLGRKLSAGLAVQNLGPGLKYDQERAPLPLNVKAGASYGPLQSLTVCLDVNKASRSDPWLGAGAEYLLEAAAGISAGPRLGYETDRSDLGGLAGLTLGVGLVLKGLSFDYAFVPMGDVGDTHRLSLKMRF